VFTTLDCFVFVPLGTTAVFCAILSEKVSCFVDPNQTTCVTDCRPYARPLWTKQQLLSLHDRFLSFPPSLATNTHTRAHTHTYTHTPAYTSDGQITSDKALLLSFLIRHQTRVFLRNWVSARRRSPGGAILPLSSQDTAVIPPFCSRVA